MKRRGLYLSRSERRAYIALACVVLIIVCLLNGTDRDDKPGGVPEISPRDRAELDAFAQKLQADSVRRSRRWEQPQAATAPESFAFNPNTADSATFLRLGLKSWQAHNALQYRRHGGQWRSAEHFGRLYGLDSATFTRLRPYIVVPPSPEAQRRLEADRAREERRRQYPRKYEPGTVINLNTADTTMLKGIPGIGSYYAGRICRYREQLGGFISTEQLSEIEGLPADIAAWLTVEADPHIRRLNVNTADFKTLVRHPYLNYEQVKAIFRHRETFGALKSWKSVSLSPAFDGTDYDRLAPYFDF